MEGEKLASELTGQITRYLEGLEFPAPKQDIVSQAQKEQAGSTLLSALEKIPEREYDSPTAVADEVTGQHE